MNPIQERIERVENKISKDIPLEVQQQYIEKYIEIINLKLDECAYFLTDTPIPNSSVFKYQIDSAKFFLKGTNPQTLYGLINILSNNVYDTPAECGSIFEDSYKSIYYKHELSKYDESSMDIIKMMDAVGLDSAIEVNTGL